MFTIRKEKVDSPDAILMMDELSERLKEITGNSGQESFDVSDMDNPRSLYVVAKENDTVIGCGAFREITQETAEVKRMYSKISNHGSGRQILEFLEVKAQEYGYQKLILETRRCNEHAVNFYLHNGYQIIENYGKYVGNKEAICFQKVIGTR